VALRDFHERVRQAGKTTPRVAVDDAFREQYVSVEQTEV